MAAPANDTPHHVDLAGSDGDASPAGFLDFEKQPSSHGRQQAEQRIGDVAEGDADFIYARHVPSQREQPQRHQACKWREGRVRFYFIFLPVFSSTILASLVVRIVFSVFTCFIVGLCI